MPEPLSIALSLEELRTTFAPFNELVFIRHFGARTEIIDLEHVKVIIDPLGDIHRGGIQGDAVNGGILAAMFDLALGLPGLFRSHPHGRSATVQLSTTFLRALRGDRLETVSWIERASSGLLFTTAETRDAKGVLCATGTGVVRQLAGHPSPKAF
jgi:acyl-coenzyme A thioesterase PaaI-like protein